MVPRLLSVSLLGREVGVLTATRGGARFAYNEDVVSQWEGMPLLSLSLPVKRRPYAEGLTGSWFRGLLPEGQRLEAIGRAIGCSTGDYFAILRHIGWECAGAVSVVEPGYAAPFGGGAQALSPQALAKKLSDLPAYGGIDPLARVSLGGYQGKLLVVCRDLIVREGRVAEARWAEPDAATVSTHIIKPQPPNRYAGIVRGEAWTMEVARSAARCAKTWLLKLDGAPISLVVERFDRVWRDGTCERVHQEDCCQAMGIEPGGKYAAYDAVRGSDPSYARLARLLNVYSDNPQEELVELLRQVVTNVILGNVDAHAKNYSLLYPSLGLPKLSPMYDVVPVVDIEPRAEYLSMRIGGVIRLCEVRRRHLLDEAHSWGLRPDQAGDVLDETLRRIEEGLDKARVLFPDVAERHEPGARSRLEALGSD